jgi:hypothetical protein
VTGPFIRYRGLCYVGFGEERQANVNVGTNEQRLRAFFGLCSLTLAVVFNDLKKEYDYINIKDFLMTLNWFKIYDVIQVLAGRWQACERYIDPVVKQYAKLIQSLKPKKIVFGGFDEHDEFPFSVDCKHFLMDEFSLDPSSTWFSHKYHSSGLVSSLLKNLHSDNFSDCARVSFSGI